MLRPGCLVWLGSYLPLSTRPVPGTPGLAAVVPTVPQGPRVTKPSGREEGGGTTSQVYSVMQLSWPHWSRPAHSLSCWQSPCGSLGQQSCPPACPPVPPCRAALPAWTSGSSSLPRCTLWSGSQLQTGGPSLAVEEGKEEKFLRGRSKLE